MTDANLFKAILAMDSYNRGYDAGILGLSDANGTLLGTASIISTSFDLGEDASGRLDKQSSFYAVTYQWGGEKIVSYRGTDDFGADFSNGWFVGLGESWENQGLLAADYYKLVTNDDPFNSTVSLTGHSLGGGLAGLIGAVYGKDAVIFDSMAFELAANNTFYYAAVDTTHTETSNLQQHFYYDPNNLPQLPDYEGISGYHIEGEALSGLVSAGGSELDEIPLGDDITMALDPVDRHNMALLVMLLYARTKEEEPGSIFDTDWKFAAPILTDSLFDNDVALAAGIADADNENTAPGDKTGTSSATEKLKSMLGYSAIEEGERPFGDTGIQALFNDASQLGRSLQNAGALSVITGGSLAVSDIIVQFAGQLAHKEIEAAQNTNWAPETGIIQDGSVAISVDGESEAWKLKDAGAGNSTEILGFQRFVTLFESTLVGSGIDAALASTIKAAATDAKALILAATAGETLDANASAESLKDDYRLTIGEEVSSLVVGGDGNNAITGTSMADVLFGGVGEDTFFGTAGNDFLIGWDDNDIADYSSATAPVTATFPSEFQGVNQTRTREVNLTGDQTGTDTLIGIEKIIGSSQDGDALDFSNSAGPIYYGYDPGTGVYSLYDTYDLSLYQNYTYIGMDLGDIVKQGKGFVDPLVEFHGFEKIVGSDSVDIISVRDSGNAEFVTVDGGGGDDMIHAGKTLAVLRGGEGEDTIYTSGAQAEVYGGGGQDHFELGPNALVEDATDQDTIDFGAFSLTGGVSFAWQESGYAYWQPFSAILMGFPSLASKFTEFWSLFALDLKLMSWMRYGLSEDGYLVAQMAQGKGGQIGVKDYELNLDTGLGTGQITVFHVDYREADGSSFGFKGFIDLALQQGFGVRAGNFDPLVIDLDKDGIDLTRQTQRDVYFDLDADGFGERTGWVREDDGLLAIDLNGDGEINDIGELFGDADTSGIDALAAYDSNGDGVINASDAQFSDLLIWQDLNQNGVADAGELADLATHGIVEISLTGRDPDVALSGGNEIREVTDVTFADGSTSIAADVWFDANQIDSKYLADVTISAEALALPGIRGFGNIKDLRTEMTLTPALATQVSDFSLLSGSQDWQTYQTAVEAILYEWAGVTGEAATALGSEGFDLRKLAYLETAGDMELAPRDIITGDVLDTNVTELQAVWEEAVATQTARLLFQAQYAGHLSGISYNLDRDIFEADSTNALADTFGNFLAALPADAAQALSVWQGEYAPALAAAISIMDRSDGIDMRNDFVIGQLVRAHEATDTLSLAELVDGLGYDDVHLNGAFTRAQDGGVHVYVGTSADETYTGGNGQDAYIFEKGNIGHDTIIDAEPGATPWGDRLRLVDLNPDEVNMARVGSDLVVTVIETGETITVQNQYATPEFAQSGRQVSSNWGIEDIQFADGSIFEAVEIGEVIGRGVDGQDDILVGTSFDDQLNGGTGNDTLRGGDGGDLYVFGLGGGADIIEDQMLNPFNDRQDLLVLTDGLSLDDMQFTRVADSDDLTITFSTPGAEADSLTLVGQFAYSYLGYDNEYALDQRIEGFASNQDSPINWVAVQQRVIEQYTTDGDDFTYGFGTSDLFQASAGNDWLSGGDSGDVYQFGYGSGHDTIEDNQVFQELSLNVLPGTEGLAGDDNLVFGAGITVSDVTFSAITGTRDLLISIDDDPNVAGASDTLRIVDQFDGKRIDLLDIFGISWFDRVEQFVFSDGTVLTWEDVLDIVTTGDAEDNSLIGDHRADTLIGNGGDDHLSGGDDGDTYIYNLGDGNDVIEDNQYDIFTTAADKLQFGAGISSSDVSFSYGATEKDVLISLTDGSTITLTGQLAGYNSYIFGVNWTDRIETLEFLDAQGQVVDTIGWDAIMTSLVSDQQTTGDDTIYGIDSHSGAWSDVIDAGAGNDTVFGRGGDDTITGGTGNDIVDGGWDNDTYIFNPGDGIDTIQDTGSGLDNADKLVIGYNVADVSVVRPSGTNDIILTFAGSTDQITVINALTGKYYNSIETYEFLDATWTPTSIAQSLVDGQITEGADIITGTGTINGLGGNDLIWGEGSNDTLSGGSGDDFLDGGNGTDTYLYSAGDGHDTIHDQGDGLDTADLLQITGYTRAQTTIEIIDGLNQIDLVFTGTGDRISIINPLANAAFARGINLIEFVDEGVTWDHSDISALVVAAQATARDDQIIGSGVADIIDGGAGDDDISGGDGKDDLSGGLGNDRLDGGTDDDIYRFGQGDGQDTISDTGNGLDNDDRLIISDYRAEQTLVQRIAGTENVLLTFAGTTDSITLISPLTGSYINQIDTYEFEADGTLWTATDLAARILLQEVTAGADDLQGFDTADTISAGVGDDSIYGYGGHDILSGDIGNDYVEGGKGNDTIIFTFGDGQDTIADKGDGLSSSDQLIIHGYSANDISAAWVGTTDNIGLTFAGTTDKITLIDGLGRLAADTIESFVFDDGTVWTKYVSGDASFVSQLSALVTASQVSDGDDTIRGSELRDDIAGGLGNDTIDGDDGNDTLAGGLGDDTVDGGWGDDTYIFNRGDGHDTIVDNGSGLDGDDRLIINGYLIEDVIVTAIAGTDDVEMTFVGTTDKITLLHPLENGVFQTIDYYEFVDGATTTVWTKQDLIDAVAGNAPPEDPTVTHLGTVAAETITGTSGDDVIDGLAGDDTLKGAFGSDTYIWGAGRDNDIVDEFGYNDATDTDVIVLDGLNAADVTLSRSGNDLSVTINASGEVLTVDDQFYSSGRGIETLTFADGSTMDRDAIALAAWIRGTSGAETLTGGSQDETLDGGAGDDTLKGGFGSDTYIWGAGRDNDIVDEFGYNDATDTDVIVLDGLNAADVTLSRSGNDLSVTINASGEVLTVDDQFYSSGRGIETLTFADGSTMDRDAIALAAWIRGTSGAETLTGGSQDETLDGGAGDDTLKGGFGSDTYVWGAGRDNDIVDEYGYADTTDTDVIVLDGLNAADVTFAGSGNDLSVTINASGELLSVDDQFRGSIYGVETLTFADGSSWDRATIESVATFSTTTGADTVSGTTGADLIIGLAGDDTLSGLPGADTFAFAAGDGSDTITDFSFTDADLIDVSAYGFASNQDFSGFTFDGTDTIVDFNGTDQVTVAGVDLTTQTNPDDAFIFT